jgi:serine/threonine protein kinase
MVIGEHPWNVSNTSIMLRQILKAAYTIPTFVSSDCKSLIQGMMKVNPTDRMTIEEILEHPWLKLAQSVPTKPSFKAPSLVMPEPAPTTMKEVSEASARISTRENSGIFSPFEESHEAGETGSMPKLVQRSLSFEHLVSREPEQLGSARRKVEGPGAALAQVRQRSATNLTQQRGPARKRPVGTFDEDDGE